MSSMANTINPALINQANKNPADQLTLLLGFAGLDRRKTSNQYPNPNLGIHARSTRDAIYFINSGERAFIKNMGLDLLCDFYFHNRRKILSACYCTTEFGIIRRVNSFSPAGHT